MDKQNVIETLEGFAKLALLRLQEYKQVEQDYRQAMKALKALKPDAGDALSPNGSKSQRRPKQAGGTSAAEIILSLLEAHPQGVTSRNMMAAGINQKTVGGALRNLGDKVKHRKNPEARGYIYTLRK